MKSIVLVVLGIVVSLIVSVLFMGVTDEPVLIDDAPVMKHEDLKGFQIGAFSDFDSAANFAGSDNIVLKINDVYCVFISVLSNSENISRMKKYLNNKAIDYFIKDLSLYEESSELLEIESMMVNANSDISFIELNKKILKIFNSNYGF